MTSSCLRPRPDVATFLLAATLTLVTGCATAPDSRGHPVPEAEAVAAVDCVRLGAEIARTEEARSLAEEQSGNAWKAMVPVVVIARKASGTAAVAEADRKLAALKVQARPCEPS